VVLTRLALWLIVTAGLGVVFTAPLWPDQRLLFTVNLAVAVSFCAAGALLWDEPGQRATAAAFGVASILWNAAWLNEWRVGPLPLISTLVGPAPALVAVWGLLRYPRPWFQRRSRWRLVVLLGFVQSWTVPLVVFSRPAWHEFRPAAGWWTVWANPGAYHAASLFYQVGTTAVAIGFGILFVVGPTRMSGPDRRHLRPVAWATAAAGAATAVSNLGWLFGDDRNVIYRFSDAEGAVLVCVPVAFLVTVVRRRLDGGRVAPLATRLRQTSDIGQVSAALRETLSDPSMQLWFWVPSARSWVDAAGRAGPPPGDAPGRFVCEIPGADGARLAVLTGDEGLARNRPLVDAAARAVALSLESGRLQAALQAEIHRVARSAERMAEVVDAEQRRIAHAIEEGAQRRLVNLERRLGRLRKTVESADARRSLAEASRQLREARQELHLLARGQAPPVLGRGGLQPAVAELVDGAALPDELDLGDRSTTITVDIAVGRFDGTIERAAYFVVAEAVANAVKHAAARRITVGVAVVVGPGDGPGGVLGIEVTDDGRGGADRRGHGLTGIFRRVHALGGTADLSTPPAGGTRVLAWLPLGPGADRGTERYG
jgi:signal transduction histidine kinase